MTFLLILNIIIFVMMLWMFRALFRCSGIMESIKNMAEACERTRAKYESMISTSKRSIDRIEDMFGDFRDLLNNAAGYNINPKKLVAIREVTDNLQSSLWDFNKVTADNWSLWRSARDNITALDIENLNNIKYMCNQLWFRVTRFNDEAKSAKPLEPSLKDFNVETQA